MPSDKEVRRIKYHLKKAREKNDNNLIKQYAAELNVAKANRKAA